MSKPVGLASGRRAAGIPRTQALVRAASLLRAVASQPAASTSALARETGLPRATAARALETLADAGLVERSLDGDGWQLGYELVRLARGADPYAALVAAARPPMERLLERCGESVLISVPRGPLSLEIVAQLDAPQLVGVASWVGRNFPLHCSAPGKLLLAELPSPELDAWLAAAPLERFTPATIVDPDVLRAELRLARQRGVAEQVDELEDGLASLAAPVRDRNATLRAIVGISAPTFRLGHARRRTLHGPVRVTAAEIEARLTPP